MFSKSDGVVVKAEMSDLIVEEKEEEVTIICTASGQPKPTILWKKLGGEISKDRKEKEGKLTLSPVSLLDDGTYICEAANVINTKTAKVKITVVPIVQFTITSPEQVEAEGGSRVQLDCQGSRLSNIIWQRQGGDLPTDHLLHSNGTLVLLNVSYGTSGLYMCKISTVFRSINTTTTIKVTYRSCSHLKASYPSTISGHYNIDPDGEERGKYFVAYCDMVDKDGVGVTIISHDKETRERVTGCNKPGCVRIDVTYTNVTLTQLANLTRVSSHCEQFTMFECLHGVKFIEDKFAWWVSRDGRPMYYWGGGFEDKDSVSCACATTNTCVKKGGHGRRRCNCKNSPPHGWRNDSGLLTDRFSLPVTQLRFGDVGKVGEEGYYTLGKFKCYGTIY